MTEDPPRLYVGSLPYVAQRHDVEALLSSSNVAIKKLDMSIDPFTGRNPGYCFIEFFDWNHAHRVLETMQGRLVRGRPIKINFKTERKQHDSFVFDRWNRNDAHLHWTAPADEGRRVYVGGLPFQNQALLNVETKELFSDFDIQAVSKPIPPHHSRQEQNDAQHYCHIDFATPEDAERAIATLQGRMSPYGHLYKICHSRFMRGTGRVRREQLGRSSKVHFGGLPKLPTQEDLEAEIRKILRGFQIQGVSRLYTSDLPGRDSYQYCFVELSDAAEAQSVVETLDGKELPSGAVYKIRLAREDFHSAGGDVKQTRNGAHSKTPNPVVRHLDRNWRSAD
ncbi:hypothetical protein AC579_7850 [Pseudocercospora musae]|uniref:RRM domain-containing protein n=1 Tax=Pseudocercospora musae TaxID=113226 RepID=A0A139I6N3_9PEZI|nr:hypothetical protein AC579_7850 [Pseudocercospora musae]